MKILEEVKMCPHLRENYMVIEGIFGEMEADKPLYDCCQGGEKNMEVPCSTEKIKECPYLRPEYKMSGLF